MDLFLPRGGEGAVGSSERLAPDEALVSGSGRRVRRLDDRVPGRLDKLLLPLGIPPPKEEDGIGLPVDGPDDLVGEGLPPFAPMRAQHSRTHRQRRVEQQHPSACPRFEVSVVGDRLAQMIA
jgi:hypothetical protein